MASSRARGLFLTGLSCYRSTLNPCSGSLVEPGSVQAVRIPEEQWGEVWRALVVSGPVSCIGQEPTYLVSERQVRMLRRKKLPFEVVPPPDGRQTGTNHA